MNTQEAIKILRNTAWLGTNEDREKTEQAIEVVAEALERESKMVHRETLEQVMWERDVAIEQLKELGYGLGEKIRTDEALKQEPSCRNTRQVGRISIQDAIEYGMRWKNAICDRGDTENSEAVQFLNMAIEALKQLSLPKIIVSQGERSQNCVKCKHYCETEDDTGVHSHCRATCSDNAQVDKLRKAAEETEDNGIRKGILKAIEVLEGDTE